PIYTMKPGAAFLAMQAKATVLPTTFAAARAWTLGSWDRFQIPKPFARVHLFFGDSIAPADESVSLKDFTRRLETVLRELTDQADRLAQS
ncbi:hypothetical protein KJ815_02405, partial [bacterium]|nr:hypothetical protein [bacterium]